MNQLHTNQLIHEKSPYLLQHAHNPVDWHAWKKETFEKAIQEDRPILLSIGYSTCHWCHVMEHESFANVDTADLMNKNFVCIKLDREERPDIDHIYMNYVMATTGSGGWPMTVFLTPEKKPFYGGTYFPPVDRHGMPGFPNLLRLIADAWKNRREEIMSSADSSTFFLKNQTLKKEGLEADETLLTASFESYSKNFDAEWGGFGRAPKFPMGHAISFLLRYAKRFKSDSALRMAEKGLSAMAKGGLRDQLGGGFHRYSTDREWHLPHFEKMLYDQALLIKAYVEAYQFTGKKEYAVVARETLDYVLKQMTHEEGGFFSAEDADSLDPNRHNEKKEGAFYVWEKPEIERFLPRKDLDIFCYVYDVKDDGNTLHAEFAGQNTLRELHSLEEAASHFNSSKEAVETLLTHCKKLLLKERQKRPAPHLDDKILTDWNGLMISAFALAAKALSEKKYEEAAEKAALFILKHLKSREGMLLHRYRAGDAAISAMLDDYAFLSQSFLDLYEATFEAKWLNEAHLLVSQMVELFWDKESGGFFLSPETSRDLIARPKTAYDGAIPSGNTVATLVLARLGRMIADESFEKHAKDALSTFSEEMRSQPTGFAQGLMALDFLTAPSIQIVMAGNPKEPLFQSMLKEIHLRFIPNKTILLNEAGSKLLGAASFLGDKIAIGPATVYVCHNYACRIPAKDLEALKKELDS